MEEKLKKEKKKITILGIDLWEIFAYFIIYSIAGYIIETSFALIRYGVLESRQSFLYGPFCSIYGVGAVCAFLLTYRFRKKPWLVAIIGGAVLSLMELLTGMAIYYLDHGRREWNYNEEIWTFGNIGGFLCGRNIICFCLAGPFTVYIVVPAIMWLAKRINRKVFLTVAYVLGGIAFADMFYNDIIHLFFPQLTKAGEFYRAKGFNFVKFTQHDKAFWKLK